MEDNTKDIITDITINNHRVIGIINETNKLIEKLKTKIRYKQAEALFRALGWETSKSN